MKVKEYYREFIKLRDKYHRIGGGLGAADQSEFNRTKSNLVRYTLFVDYLRDAMDSNLTQACPITEHDTLQINHPNPAVYYLTDKPHPRYPQKVTLTRKQVNELKRSSLTLLDSLLLLLRDMNLIDFIGVSKVMDYQDIVTLLQSVWVYLSKTYDLLRYNLQLKQ